jgi:hypothetical protein
MRKNSSSGRACISPSDRGAANHKAHRQEYLLVGVFAIAVIFSACNSAVDSDDNQYARLYRSAESRDIAHPNGLWLRLPTSLPVTETSGGFEVTAPNVRSLSPMNIKLHLHEEPPQSPTAAAAERRMIANRKISYLVSEEKEAVGSGGAEYMLNAWEEIPGGYVSYQQTEQAETGRPRHEFAWYVIGQTGLRQKTSAGKSER